MTRLPNTYQPVGIDAVAKQVDVRVATRDACHNVSVLPECSDNDVSFTVQAKASVPPLGRDLKPAETHIGRETSRPGPLKQECRRFIIRFGHPERFDNRVVCHGYQTRVKTKPQRVMFDDRLIRHGCQTPAPLAAPPSRFDNRMIRLGCQTSWTPWPIPSTLANRVICRGVQTLHRKSYALPRLGEPLSESHHAAR